MTSKAIVLVSGGLDSATCLALAINQGYECYALSFNYGQRSISELNAARRVAQAAGVKDHKVISLGLDTLGGSALTDTSIAIPEGGTEGIPVTYVPARNTVFLSYGLAWAEVLDADALFIGVNSVDYLGYPDCRPEFIEAYARMMNLATKKGVEGGEIALKTPLIHLSKGEIIKTGTRFGVDYSLTVSCYQADGDGAACGACDSCLLRKAGFAEAGIEDPTRYK